MSQRAPSLAWRPAEARTAQRRAIVRSAMRASNTERRAALRVPPATVVIVLLAAALATWVVTADRMRGMDAGPGTDLGGLGWFVGIWMTMMAAMMLPSVAPMVLVFHRLARERALRRRPFTPTWIFVLSYLGVWLAYGLAAYALSRVLAHLDHGVLDWDRGGRYLAGGAIAAAALYELTPLKSVCLRHCRSPLHFLARRWREGTLGALRIGAVHGAYCVGCCFGLMVLLFALGVMSLTWMALITALIFAQKVLPKGAELAKVFAVVFVAAGVWVAAAPETVPGLTLPNSSAADRARMMHEPAGRMQPAGSRRPEPLHPAAGSSRGAAGTSPSIARGTSARSP